MDVKLPAKAWPFLVLDYRHDVDTEAGSHECDRCSLALDLKILDRLARILFDQQFIDCVVEAIECIFVCIATGKRSQRGVLPSMSVKRK